MFKNASNYIELLRNWQRTLAPPRPPQVPQVAFGDGSKKSIELQCVNRICCDCTERRVCKKCGVAKPSTAYTAGEWRHAASGSRRGNCLECFEEGNIRSRGVTNVWKCIECKEKYAKCEFSAWLRGRKNQSKHITARCNLCTARQDIMKAESCAATVAAVVRR